MLAIFGLAVIITGSVFGMKQYNASRSATSHDPWFASYVDVTSTPTYAFEQLGETDHKDVVLSFIVASPTKGCTPTWGGAYSLDKAGSSLDLDRRIARLKQLGGHVAVSFGGLRNDELALKCNSVTELVDAYKSVIDRYELNTIDLDLEQGGLTNTTAGARRAEAVAKLQADQRKAGKNLAVWVTLPVAPQGFSEAGTSGIAQLLDKGVDLAGVNAMTMDYGESRGKMSMIDATKKALTQAHRQLGILYERAGTHLNSATLWSKLGATPMIGQNDEESEVFTLKDAKDLNKFARSHGMARMSMWSANRDITCGSNYVDLKVVSDSCSGVKEDSGSFAEALGSGFKGSLAKSAGLVTSKERKSAKQLKDDPKNSPYQIWDEDGTYLEGTKVVWHHNVYQAKWWTQGDMPDSPVLQSWETPWELIGPVLPGEKPVKQQTLPAGTYPEWDGVVNYDAGQRVLYKGIPYQAKWWNQGASPAAASSSPDTSPWVPLTQAQINEIVGEQ
jgi:chitinase